MSKDTSEFMSRVRDLAERLDHKYLADYLGIRLPTLRNWIYRNTPNEIVVRALKPRVDRKWKRICK